MEGSCPKLSEAASVQMPIPNSNITNGNRHPGLETGSGNADPGNVKLLQSWREGDNLTVMIHFEYASQAGSVGQVPVLKQVSPLCLSLKG